MLFRVGLCKWGSLHVVQFVLFHRELQYWGTVVFLDWFRSRAPE